VVIGGPVSLDVPGSIEQEPKPAGDDDHDQDRDTEPSHGPDSLTSDRAPRRPDSLTQGLATAYQASGSACVAPESPDLSGGAL